MAKPHKFSRLHYLWRDKIVKACRHFPMIFALSLVGLSALADPSASLAPKVMAPPPPVVPAEVDRPQLSAQRRAQRLVVTGWSLAGGAALAAGVSNAIIHAQGKYCSDNVDLFGDSPDPPCRAAHAGHYALGFLPLAGPWVSAFTMPHEGFIGPSDRQMAVFGTAFFSTLIEVAGITVASIGHVRLNRLPPVAFGASGNQVWMGGRF